MKTESDLAQYLAYLEAEHASVMERFLELSDSERRGLGAYTLRMRKSDLECCLMYLGEFMSETCSEAVRPRGTRWPIGAMFPAAPG